MSLSRTATRGALTTLGGQWIKFVVQSLGLVLLARLLVPADFGVYAMATAIVGVALLFGDFGLSMASIQAESVSQEQRSNLFWLNIAIGVVCALAVFFLAHPIADFYRNQELVPVVRTLSLVFLFQAAGAQFSANASRQFRFRLLAWIDVSSQAVALVAAVATALLGFGYWALVFQQVTVAVVTLAVLMISSRWWPGLPRRNVPLKSMIVFGSNTLGVQLVNYLSTNVDDVVLGRFAGAAALGIYDRAYQIFGLPLQQIAAPMTRVALPVLSRLTDRATFENYIGRAQLLLTYGIGGVFAIAVAVSSPLLALILGPGWGAAPPLFSILAIGGLFQSMGYVYYWVFLAKGKTGLQLRFSIISRLIMVGLICVGVIWGSTGVAVGVSAGLFVNWLVLSVFAIPRTGVHVGRLIKLSITPLCTYLVMVAAVWPVSLILGDRFGSFLTLLVLLGGCVIVLGLAYLVVPRLRTDVSVLIETVRKGLRRA